MIFKHFTIIDWNLKKLQITPELFRELFVFFMKIKKIPMKTKHLPQSIIDTAIMEYSIICFAHVHKKQKTLLHFPFLKV